jgi:hypothetical protein
MKARLKMWMVLLYSLATDKQRRKFSKSSSSRRNPYKKSKQRKLISSKSMRIQGMLFPMR